MSLKNRVGKKVLLTGILSFVLSAGISPFVWAGLTVDQIRTKAEERLKEAKTQAVQKNESRLEGQAKKFEDAVFERLKVEEEIKSLREKKELLKQKLNEAKMNKKGSHTYLNKSGAYLAASDIVKDLERELDVTRRKLNTKESVLKAKVRSEGYYEHRYEFANENSSSGLELDEDFDPAKLDAKTSTECREEMDPFDLKKRYDDYGEKIEALSDQLKELSGHSRDLKYAQMRQLGEARRACGVMLRISRERFTARTQNPDGECESEATQGSAPLQAQQNAQIVNIAQTLGPALIQAGVPPHVAQQMVAPLLTMLNSGAQVPPPPPYVDSAEQQVDSSPHDSGTQTVNIPGTVPVANSIQIVSKKSGKKDAQGKDLYQVTYPSGFVLDGVSQHDLQELKARLKPANSSSHQVPMITSSTGTQATVKYPNGSTMVYAHADAEKIIQRYQTLSSVPVSSPPSPPNQVSQQNQVKNLEGEMVAARIGSRKADEIWAAFRADNPDSAKWPRGMHVNNLNDDQRAELGKKVLKELPPSELRDYLKPNSELGNLVFPPNQPKELLLGEHVRAKRTDDLGTAFKLLYANRENELKGVPGLEKGIQTMKPKKVGEHLKKMEARDLGVLLYGASAVERSSGQVTLEGEVIKSQLAQLDRKNLARAFRADFPDDATWPQELRKPHSDEELGQELQKQSSNEYFTDGRNVRGLVVEKLFQTKDNAQLGNFFKQRYQALEPDWFKKVKKGRALPTDSALGAELKSHFKNGNDLNRLRLIDPAGYLQLQSELIQGAVTPEIEGKVRRGEELAHTAVQSAEEKAYEAKAEKWITGQSNQSLGEAFLKRRLGPAQWPSQLKHLFAAHTGNSQDPSDTMLGGLFDDSQGKGHPARKAATPDSLGRALRKFVPPAEIYRLINERKKTE